MKDRFLSIVKHFGNLYITEELMSISSIIKPVLITQTERPVIYHMLPTSQIDKPEPAK